MKTELKPRKKAARTRTHSDKKRRQTVARVKAWLCKTVNRMTSDDREMVLQKMASHPDLTLSEAIAIVEAEQGGVAVN